MEKFLWFKGTLLTTTKFNIMFKVNLQERMIAGKKKSEFKKELDGDIVIKEFNNIIENNTKEDLYVLQRLGMDHNIRRAQEKIEAVKDRTTQEIELDKFLSQFDKTKVFHISEIKKLCGKYGLRFLDSNMYKGTIDPLLPSKIKQFESEHKNIEFQVRGGLKYKIMAPTSSFELQERPKDPLMFADLGSGYYYLVHKWGNDLSIFRALFEPFKALDGFAFLIVTLIPFLITVACNLERPAVGDTIMRFDKTFSIFLKFELLPVLLLLHSMGKSCLRDEFESKFEK
jgi:hypothetical protein